MSHLTKYLDKFTVALVLMVLLASLLPAQGTFAQSLALITDLGVALLFFLHGAKLSTREVIHGLTNWKLHLLILSFTFLVFPLISLGLKPLSFLGLTDDLLTGFLFLATVPSTVQSAIALNSIARGNVSAAICAASLSNLLGVFFTPLLVALLINLTGDIGFLGAIYKIVLLILLPFLVGHLSRRWIGEFIIRHRSILGLVDRGVILLIVYAAFSESVVDGLWQTLSLSTLAITALLTLVLLFLLLFLTRQTARLLHLDRPDEITLVFTGSQKSLASGLPMARVLFAGTPALGAIVLPLMLYHQFQLIVCAVIATRYGRRADAAEFEHDRTSS